MSIAEYMSFECRHNDQTKAEGGVKGKSYVGVFTSGIMEQTLRFDS